MFEQYRTKIIRAAKAAAPNELAAVIFDGDLRLLENVAPEPTKDFFIKDDDLLKIVYSPRCTAVVHSHPALLTEEGVKQARLAPSSTDMQAQAGVAKPYIIAAENPASGVWEVFDFGDHLLDEPILEQPFRHGVRDCYSLIRKYFWQHRLCKLRDFPRDEQWWGAQRAGIEPTADLYLDNFELAGFERVYPRTIKDLLPGDVFMFKLESKVFNHAGVFVGNGRAWHHVHGRFSESMIVTEGWFRRVIWVRQRSLVNV